MKLIVVTARGDRQTIDLEPPLLVDDQGTALNVITDSKGMEYFFDKDGYYDGWGTAMPSLFPPA